MSVILFVTWLVCSVGISSVEKNLKKKVLLIFHIIKINLSYLENIWYVLASQKVLSTYQVVPVKIQEYSFSTFFLIVFKTSWFFTINKKYDIKT